MIYCVEDDASIREIELYTLRSMGYEAKGFEDGNAFLAALKEQTPQLVILDLMLPGPDGLELLKRIKADFGLAGIPVIIATARGAEHEKICGLDLGADDYLVKPFGMMEMVSRVKAVLRRCSPTQNREILSAGGLTINLAEHTVAADGKRLTLTFKEFELLRLFLAAPGVAFTRERLLANVWEEDFLGETRTVDVHIRTLRQKLGRYGAKIETVRNVGYRWEAET